MVASIIQCFPESNPIAGEKCEMGYFIRDVLRCPLSLELFFRR